MSFGKSFPDTAFTLTKIIILSAVVCQFVTEQICMKQVDLYSNLAQVE